MTTSGSSTTHDHPAGAPAAAVPAPREALPAETVAPGPPAPRQHPAAVWGVAAGMATGAVGTLAAAAIVVAPAVAAIDAGGSGQVPEPRVAFGGNVSVPGRASTTFGDGAWQVGVDLVPGTYATVGGVDCRHALRPAVIGQDIVHSAIGQGPATVVLAEDGSWFVAAGCGTWTRVG